MLAREDDRDHARAPDWDLAAQPEPELQFNQRIAR